MTQEAVAPGSLPDDLESLEEWKARHLALLNSIDAIVWEAPATFTGFTFVSEQAERLLGYPVERWVSEPNFWVEHMHPEDRDWCPQYCAEKTAAGEAHDFEYRMVAADGRTVWLRDIVTVVHEDGKPSLLRGVMTDITALKDASARLSTQEREYRDIFEATSDGLVIVDLDSPTILDANPSFCRMHGYEDMKGQNLSNSIHPDSYPLFQDYSKTIRAGGEFRGRAKDVRRGGSLFDVEVHARAIVYRGRLAGLGVVRDITDQIQSEKLLQEHVEARTHELHTLLEVAGGVAGTLDLNELVHLIFDQLEKALQSSAASVILIEGSDLVVFDSLDTERGGAVRIPNPRSSTEGPPDEPVMKKYPCVQAAASEQFWTSIDAGSEVVISDVAGSQRESTGLGELAALVGNGSLPIGSWMAVPLVVNGKSIGYLGVASDYAGHFQPEHARLARAFADHAAVAVENARLFANVQGRTRELATLLEVSESVTSTLELRPLLDVILDQARRVIDYDRATFVLLEGGNLEIVAVRGFGDLAPPADQQPASPMRLEGSRGTFLQSVLADGQTWIIDDIHSESPAGRRFQQAWNDDADEPVHRIDIIRSWMAVPVIMRGRAIGLMTMSKTEPAFFTRHYAEIAEALARHAGIAIENARLFGSVQDRTHELSTLLDASHALASTLELESLFEVALEHLEAVVPCLGCSIGIFENDALVTKASHLAPGRTQGDAALGVPLPLARMGPLPGKILAGKTVGIDDILGDSEEAHWFRLAVGDILTDESKRFIRSWMAVPIQHTNRVIGMISVSTDQPGFYTPEHARLARSVATHIALAIENARLYDQAQKLAATEERQRLARELHDSVSQALYGISLGASTAQDLLGEGDETPLRKPLDYILSLAEAGLAEMRALIFELRPDSLQEEGLVAAVTKQVEATRARYGLNVTWEHLEEPDAPLATKEAVYRIVQEALHNIVKHAKATNVVVDLHALPDGITAEVRDDGIGFDTAASFAGHLGLKSMRERAEKIGGSVEIATEPGAGTTIRASLPPQS